MRKNGVCSIVFFIVLDLMMMCGPAVFAAQKADESSFEKFLADPSQESWDSLEADIHAGSYGPRKGLFQQVLEYHDARTHRDLPNSMALVGITPKQFWTLQAERAESAIGFIRAKESPDLWRLIEKMAVQDFDDELAWTAFELAHRLSAARFASLADKVLGLPERTRLVKLVRDNWESPLQKFLADPSRAQWQDLEAFMRSDWEPSTYRQIVKYHDARRERDRPGRKESTGSGLRGNDGGKEGTPKPVTSDPESIKDPAAAVEHAFKKIQAHESFYLWQLFEKMAVQDFDDELAWTACEIAARLSKAKFRKIAKEVARVRPERTWVIEVVAEKWLNQKNRSKGRP